MSDKNKRVSHNKDLVLLIRGLIIGKLLTLVVVGGILWWLRPRLWDFSAPSFQSSSTANATATASNFQKVTNVPIGSFNYGGSPAWAPIRQLVDAQIVNARPELQLRYVHPAKGSPGSSSGIRMLLNGQLDFAQSSRPLTKEESAIAQQRGFTLEQRPIAIDGVAVVVNPSLNVPGLTVDQLQQIYRGEIANWSQVGGPDLPITPFSQRPEDGDTGIFSAQDGLQQPFGPNVQYVYSTTEALRRVSQTPGGLYYASARGVIAQCSVKPLPLGRTANQLVPPYREPLVSPEQCPSQRNQLNLEAFENGSYPITRNLFVIIKQNQGKEQQAGEAYANLLLTEQGQNALARAGFTQTLLEQSTQ
jgi:phosphate transport system substrate-binding protein